MALTGIETIAVVTAFLVLIKVAVVLIGGKKAWVDSVGKKFGRLKNVVLGRVGVTDSEQKKEYVHHSFRHGFVTMLIEAGFNELEFADLTGHSKSFLGRTEAGRTYTSTAQLEKLKSIINALPVAL